MEFFSFLKKFNKTERAYTPTQWTPLFGGEATERGLLANNKEWVFIAANRIATSTASIRFKVMRYKNNGDDQEVFTGPLVDFIEKPAQNFTGKDFIFLNTIWKELTGNAFWERDGRKVKPLIPTNIRPVVSGGVITSYKYSENGQERIINAEDVLHDRYVDPAKPYWGVGKLAKIARWVDTSSYANEFLRRFFTNGATFGGFIETEEESEERIKLIKLGLANDHVGVENAHKMAVLPKGSKFAPATATMSDMEMGATDDRYRDKILSGFGVPKVLVGLTTDVNRASAEAAEYVFARYTIKPIADDFVEFLNNNVAPLFDESGEYYFAYDEFIPVNMEVELKEREIALGRQPYKTVNEVRASIGLTPVKGGDTIYGNPFQVPLGEPTASPDPVPGDEDPKDDNEPTKAIPARIRTVLVRERALDSLVGKIAKAITKTVDLDAVSHKQFVARVEQHEKLLAGKVRDFNNKQQREVVAKLAQIVKAVNKGDLFDMDEQIDVLIDAVSPMLKGLMLEQAIEEYKAQGFQGEFNITNPSINKAIELASKRLAKSYNNTTALLLKNALNTGISEGDDITQLTERIKTVYEFSDTSRAAAVARTESVYIANEGSREAYRQSGIVETLRWYTGEDELVCEFCGPMNGKVISITETFFKKGEEIQGTNGGTLKTDYRAIDVPPLHTNCRCLIRPEKIEIN